MTLVHHFLGMEKTGTSSKLSVNFQLTFKYRRSVLQCIQTDKSIVCKMRVSESSLSITGRCSGNDHPGWFTNYDQHLHHRDCPQKISTLLKFNGWNTLPHAQTQPLIGGSTGSFQALAQLISNLQCLFPTSSYVPSSGLVVTRNLVSVALT